MKNTPRYLPVRSRWGAEPLIRNALFRVKKGRMIHTLEFSTI
eukprot:COSAG02_NODE_5752_length_4065_cov_2.444781_7_plen_41_part_01